MDQVKRPGADKNVTEDGGFARIADTFREPIRTKESNTIEEVKMRLAIVNAKKHFLMYSYRRWLNG